jgi:hypothetical protein
VNAVTKTTLETGIGICQMLWNWHRQDFGY